MFSMMQQEKTILRDERGATVYRRCYLCDGATDIDTLPREDAPGSAAVVADGGALFLLDHSRTWRRAGHIGGREVSGWRA